MKIEKTNKLKHFITLIDAEVFPKDPCPVFIYKLKYTYKNWSEKRTIASFSYFEKRKLVRKIFLLIHSLIQLVFDSLRFYGYKLLFFYKHNPKSARRLKLLMSKTLQLINLRIIDFHRIKYKVIRTAGIQNLRELDLLIIAWHEVRHRVQYHKAYQKIDNERDLVLRVIFKKQQNVYLESRNHYEVSDIEKEVDADFVAYNLRYYILQELGDIETINDESLRLFMKDYMFLMKWKRGVD